MSQKVTKARKALLAFGGLMVGVLGGWFVRSDSTNFQVAEEFTVLPYFTDTANADFRPLPPPPRPLRRGRRSGGGGNGFGGMR